MCIYLYTVPLVCECQGFTALLFLPVTVSFDPLFYTVTEGVDGVVNLMLVRSGGLTRTIVVSVYLAPGGARGMTHHCLMQYCIFNTIIEQIKFSLTIYTNYVKCDFVATFVWLY